jgi:hypothetical protein
LVGVPPLDVIIVSGKTLESRTRDLAVEAGEGLKGTEEVHGGGARRRCWKTVLEGAL